MNVCTKTGFSPYCKRAIPAVYQFIMFSATEMAYTYTGIAHMHTQLMESHLLIAEKGNNEVCKCRTTDTILNMDGTQPLKFTTNLRRRKAL